MDGTIFAVGLFVFLLLVGGLIFTVVEVRRLERASVNQGDTRAPVASK